MCHILEGVGSLRICGAASLPCKAATVFNEYNKKSQQRLYFVGRG